MQKAPHEQKLAADLREERRRCIERDAEQEERVIGVLAPDIVRQRRPEETAADIEQRQQPGEAGGDRGDGDFLIAAERVEAELGVSDQLAAEDFLQHRRGHADDADAGGDVEAEHPPDQPELRRLVRVLQMHVMLRDHRLGFARRRPAFRPPAGRRQPIAERADHHEEEIDRAHGEERLPRRRPRSVS